MRIEIHDRRIGSVVPFTLLVHLVFTILSGAGNAQVAMSAEPQQSAEIESNTSLGLASPRGEPADPKYTKVRAQMVATQLANRDIHDQRVMDAMNSIPRHEFVPTKLQHRAYDDSPLPIGHQQTISQPYIVALMTQLVEPESHKKALDVGTGSGYQAAVLAKLVKSVQSIEIVKPLANESGERLKKLGYKNVTVRHGDGYRGWPSEAPFDIIIVAAAPDHVPQPLVVQLAPGGKMVIPVGKYFQRLMLIEKKKDGSTDRKYVAPVAFVPMTGEAQQEASRELRTKRDP